MSRRRSRKPKIKKTPGASSLGKSAVADGQLVAKLMESFSAGNLELAETCARELCDQYPGDAIGWKGLGAICNARGRSEDALAPMRRALELSPDDYEIHNNLGLALQRLGLLTEAAGSYSSAIELRPDYAAAHNNLANVYSLLGRVSQAEQSYRNALAINPDYAEAHNNLGTLLQDSARLAESELSFKRALQIKPAYAKAHSNLGITQAALGRKEEAEESYRYAAQLAPELPDPRNNLGQLLRDLGRLDEAIVHLREAIRLGPNIAVAHNNLGLVAQDLSWFKEARSCFQTAMNLSQNSHDAFSNLLFSSNYDDQLSSSELYSEYKSFGAWARAQTRHQFDHSSRSHLNAARLRIGYSSPDFRGHASRLFMEPLLSNHDRGEFELFAYSNTASTDHHTERLKGYFDHWVDVRGLSDGEMAQRIYDDQIDILVDMAGHTSGNRLLVFAMRPAPIQVSSNIGYGYTSGLEEIDYFLGDENLTPAGCEAYFSEQIWRLPAPCSAFEPPDDSWALTPPPSLGKGYITFGSLVRTVRLNDSVFRVWKEILNRVPNSRLRLDQKAFRSESVKELFWARLAEIGVARERVSLECSDPHLAAYQDIDIALDPWPHNGGTTTMEALWMGVPVLSKRDRPSMGCIGATWLKPLGLQEWIADTESEYIATAVTKASNLMELSRLRTDLRKRLQDSPFLRADIATKNIEDAYRLMMKKYVG